MGWGGERKSSLISRRMEPKWGWGMVVVGCIHGPSQQPEIFSKVNTYIHKTFGMSGFTVESNTGNQPKG